MRVVGRDGDGKVRGVVEVEERVDEMVDVEIGLEMVGLVEVGLVMGLGGGEVEEVDGVGEVVGEFEVRGGKGRECIFG